MGVAAPVHGDPGSRIQTGLPRPCRLQGRRIMLQWASVSSARSVCGRAAAHPPCPFLTPCRCLSSLWIPDNQEIGWLSRVRLAAPAAAACRLPRCCLPSFPVVP